MSAAKRPASNSFGSSQMVVKRQKSNADINGKAVTVTNGTGTSGALIQSVSLPLSKLQQSVNGVLNYILQEGGLMDTVCLGATHKWTTSTDNGAYRSVMIPNPLKC